MIPFIENKDAITSANALMNMMSSVVQLSTWALGGILMSLIGAKYLFLFALVLEMISYFYFTPFRTSIYKMRRQIFLVVLKRYS